MNIEEAIDDVKTIKRILKRTREDVSDIALFFIWIGLLNILVIILKIVGVPILDRMTEVPMIAWKVFYFLDVLPILGDILLFIIYYLKVRTRGNDISISIIKIWGILLIGGKIFSKLFLALATEGVNTELYLPYTKIFDFIFPAIGFIVLGIIIHEKLIVIITTICICLYLFLIKLNLNIALGNFNE